MRAFAIGWAVVTVTAAGLLSAGLGPEVDLPEGGHLAGHLVLFAVLAAALARDGRDALVLAIVVAVGAAVEAAQAFASGGGSVSEAAYDIGVDALAGMLGLALGGRQAVAVALGSWLHPAVVFPVGLFGTFYASQRDPLEAAAWAGVGVACIAPAGLAWIAGIRSGRLSDADLKARHERPPLFLLGTASAALFAALAHGLAAPTGVIEVANGMLLGAAALTALTLAGLKVSGHVAVSLLLAVAIAPWSPRGMPLLVASGALLSWARVAAGCHRPVEVAAAWALAGAAFAAR